MIITIDTSKDSVNDIKKAIALLQQIAGDSASYNSYGNTNNNTYNNASNSYANPFSSPLPSSSNYSNSQNPTQTTSQSVQSQNASDGFMAMFGDVPTNSNSSVQTQNSTNSAQPLPSIIGLPVQEKTTNADGTPKKRVAYEFDTY